MPKLAAQPRPKPADAPADPPSPWPTDAQRAADREAKRLAIRRVAARLFNERGFRATSLEDIAGALRITKPTLYNYFAGKDEILFSCVSFGCDMIEAAASAADGAGGGLERLRRMMLAYAETIAGDFGRCVITVSEHDLSPQSRAEFRSLKRAIDAKLRQAIAAAMKDGSVGPGDVRLTAFTVAGALNWIAHWYDPAGRMTAGQMAEAVVERLIAGLADRPSRRSRADG